MFVIVKLLACVISIKALKSCHICGSRGNQGLKYPLAYIETEKKTCAEIAVDVMKESGNLNANQNCKELQIKYKQCCDGTILTSTTPPRVTTLPPTSHTGPHRACNLCRNGDYPSTPSHVIHLLYIGASSCRNYYIAGKEGKIPTHLCDPLRYFAQDPCGCSKMIQTRSIKPAPPISIATITITSLTFLMILYLTIKKLKKQPRLSVVTVGMKKETDSIEKEEERKEEERKN